MADTVQNSEPPIIRRSDGTDGQKKGTLLPGSKLYTGKAPGAKNRLRQLREYCEKLAKDNDTPFKDPHEMFAYIFLTGKDPLEVKINKELGEESPFHPSKINYTMADGTTRRVKGFVDLSLRVDCARLLAPFMRPKLSSTEVTGEDGKPLFEQDRAIASSLSQDPDVRKLFETIAEKAAGAGSQSED